MKDSQYQRGDIYWVNLDPTIGSKITKTRPAVIVSNNAQNKAGPRIIVAPMTSITKKVYPFEILVILDNKQSKVMLDQIRTVDCIRLGSKLGRLTIEEIEELDKEEEDEIIEGTPKGELEDIEIEPETSNTQEAGKERDLLRELHSPKRKKIPNLVPPYLVTVLSGEGRVIGEPKQLIMIQKLLDGTAGSISHIGQVRQVAQDAAESLAGLHEARYVHIDVKPDNLLIEITPEGPVRGRMHDLGCTVTSGANNVKGSPAYIAPEALDREPGATVRQGALHARRLAL